MELSLDKDGYYKRSILPERCISCGKCLQVCPADDQVLTIKKTRSYVCYSRDKEVVINSSSGGFAYELAKHYIKKGYTIVGAAWTEKAKEVKHILVQDENELRLLQKSKYVQSSTVDAFKRLKAIDKAVIFATPCQIAGLRKCYSDKKGFLFVDFDCMGPAGYQLWGKYYDYLNAQNLSGIQLLTMRTKKKSWMNYGTHVIYHDGAEYYNDKYHDPFCQLYHFAHLIQDTCTSCKYLNSTKADIRIGDAWNHIEGFSKNEIKKRTICYYTYYRTRKKSLVGNIDILCFERC